MKSLLIFILLSLVIVSVSCSKFENRRTNDNLYNDEIIEDGMLKDLPGYATQACQVFDKNGEVVCTGTRCSAPIGSCRPRRLTACKCVKMMNGNYELPEGMNPDDFLRTWNDSTGNVYLTNLGYFEK
jgi:hypothetical protein